MTAHNASKRLRTFVAAAGAVALIATLGSTALPASAAEKAESTVANTMAANTSVTRAAAAPAAAKLQRPVLQVMSQYRSGNRTSVKVASIVPIQGAASYRLERYNKTTGKWLKVTNCARVCEKIYSNRDLSGTESFRMRAVDSRGQMSLPSVAVGVTPAQWNKKAKPGATVTYRLGPASYGIVAKAVQVAMLKTLGPCAFDSAKLAAIGAVVQTYWTSALKAPTPTSVLGGLALSLAEQWYANVYTNQCYLIEGLANAMLHYKPQIAAGGNADFSVTSTWRGTHDLDLPDYWVCNVDLPAGAGDVYRPDLNERSCLNFAVDRMWYVAGQGSSSW